jgi:hypothetical protein
MLWVSAVSLLVLLPGLIAMELRRHKLRGEADSTFAGSMIR